MIAKKSVFATIAFVVGATLLASSAALAVVASWSTPVDVSASDGGNQSAQVVINANGLATAVWESYSPNDVIQSSNSVNGGQWSSPVTLSALGGDVSQPDISINSTGQIVAVWRAILDGVNGTIQYSTSLSGESWSAPVSLSAAGHQTTNPDVTIDSSGRVTAVWTRFAGSDTVIQSRSSADGVTWSNTVDLTNAGADASIPKVAVDPVGRVTAVWAFFDGLYEKIQSRSSLSGGSWSPVVDLTDTSADASAPQVLADASGRATAVWTRFGSSDDVIQSSSSVNGGSWSSPATLSGAGGEADNSQLAVDPAGVISVVWLIDIVGPRTIQSSSSVDGVSWSSPVNLSTIGQDATSPQIAVDASGHATALWVLVDLGANIFTVQSSTLAPGSSWSSPVNVSALGQEASNPQISVNPSGFAVAVWEIADGSDVIVQSGYLDNRIAPVPVLPATGGDTTEFSTLLAGGTFLVLLGGVTIFFLRYKWKSL